MEHNSLEIILLACAILALVALMSLILLLGSRVRNKERRDSQEKSSAHIQGRDCLFEEVFAKHPDHRPALIRPYDNDSPSVIGTVRRRSQTIVGAVQHELRDLRRNLKAESLAGSSQLLWDEESEAGLQSESSSEEQMAQNQSDTNATGKYRGKARKRTSSTAKLQALKPRKSQEQPLTDRDKSQTG